MLEPEEVDEGYFTPVASTTLANIFKSDSNNDESVNSSLKYKPPQPKKTESKSESPKSEDPNASHCVFSSSVIAYEWLEGAHKCKGKVGFAVLRMVKTDISKMILYSSDKSTLFCTTMSPELQVTLKRTMISLYDDHKKYWGLCFNHKNIGKIKEILQQENVVVKDYESPPAKPMDESEHTDENETESINIIETNTPALKNDKASILSRIANVGHAILPSPVSTVKNSTTAEKNDPIETFDSNDKLTVMSDETDTSITKTMHDSTRSIAIQAKNNNHEVNNSTVSNNVGKLDDQHPLLSLPNHDNHLCPSTSRHVPIPKLVPIITNLECGISASEIGVLINKLTHLQGLVKTVEILETFEKGNNKICPCKDKVVNEPNLGMDTMDSIKVSENKSKQNLEKISTLEELIREKDNVILNLQSELKTERLKSYDLIKEDKSTKCLEQQVEDLKQDLIIKNEELKNMLPRNEVDIMIANIIKKLMNDTFRSLASNFESDSSYSGSNVKGILATVIKKHTVDSLSSLLPNRSSEPTDEC